MSRTQTTTMPYAQPCPDCQFCRNCDTTPGRSPQRPRDCQHNQIWTYIEPNTPAAANHRCFQRAPHGARPSSVQQQGHPSVPRSSQVPLNQVQQPPNDSARRGATFSNIRISDYATGRYGFDYRHVPDTEGPMLFTDIESSGHASVHVGNTYEYDDPRVAGPPAPGSQPGVHGLGAQQPVHSPPTNPFATNNPYRRH